MQDLYHQQYFSKDPSETVANYSGLYGIPLFLKDESSRSCLLDMSFSLRVHLSSWYILWS